jgi:hypothetical protein
MLADSVRRCLRSNQLVVVIGARGTGKSRCGGVLADGWRRSGLEVLQLDASTASHPSDLDGPVAEVLGCDPSTLTTSSLAEGRSLRIIVDRCEHLYEQTWLVEWQERWRSFLFSRQSEGRVSAVLFGRPLFREIAGGDASPLLNAGPVLPTQALSSTDIADYFGVATDVATAVQRKTGGHPRLTGSLLEAIDRDVKNLGPRIRGFCSDHRHYVLALLGDHVGEAREILGALLEAKGGVEQSVLVRRYFPGAPARGVEAVDDLAGCGLVARDEAGRCRLAADLIHNVEGLKALISVPAFHAPPYEQTVMDEAHRVAFEAENQLRLLVVQNLGSGDEAWWTNCVPPEVRGKAEGRQEKDWEASAAGEDTLHPIAYLHLGEVFDLVYQHWQQVFRPAFGLSESAVSELAGRFETCRNRLAHARPLSTGQYEELLATTRRLGLMS